MYTGGSESVYWIGGLWTSKAGSRCMETTIRSTISSPSTSDNKLRLSYIWMYVSWDRYRDTYLDIWVRRVIIIIGSVMVIVMIIVSCYSSRYDSCYIVTPIFLLWFQWWFRLFGLCLPHYDSCLSCYVFSLGLSYDLQLWFYMLGIAVVWDKGIFMRVSLFGLFLRRISLIGP